MTETKEQSRLLVQDRAIVVPGEVLAEGMDYLPSHGTYRKEEKIFANQTGLLVVEGKVLKSIPMAGAYLPKKNDVIIAKVIDILMTGWRVDTNSPYSAVLPLKDATFDYIKKGADLTTFFDLDDHLVCKIIQVTSQNLVDISMKGPGLKKLQGGRFIRVNAAKVPRIIGKRGSMVNMIKAATGCQLVVGQNGILWLNGEPEQEKIALDTVHIIEREAHISGLTARIQAYLKEKTGKEVEPVMDDLPPERPSYSDRPRAEHGDRDRYQGGGRPPRRDGRSFDRRDGGNTGGRPPPRRGPPQRREGDQ